ncbi:FUSC family protein [Leifsonia sp. NPDC058292]|uniref:FUSC family protein n=1 Tax=Leifsonia sp. NPDC058292 TaxID=3346428 RepID=UPI0036DA2D3F
MRLKAWYLRHDPQFAALRRATRTAIVMPLLFAFAFFVIGDPAVATFSAFGSFAMLMLVDFGGPMRERLQAQVGLALTGAVFVCLGTLVSKPVWLAVPAMAAVAFLVLFAGTISSVLASASTSLLLAFILPVTLPGTVDSIAPRLLGWGMAAAVSIAAIAILWPAPVREPLRAPATDACRALARRLRADVAFFGGNGRPNLTDARAQAVAEADEAVASLQSVFLGSPYRPTGLSTSARTVVRLVDELNWLNARISQSASSVAVGASSLPHVHESAMTVKSVAADVLDRGADLLARPGGDPEALEREMARLAAARVAAEATAMAAPVLPGREAGGDADPIGGLVSALDPGFRAQEISQSVDQVARNIALTARAERRTWWQRVLGRQPGDGEVPGPLTAAEQRASGYFTWHSGWLQNSIRGAAALAIAVLLADITGVQHSFWVVLGTLSVLRSNALSTGQTALRGVVGTAVGVVVGALLLFAIGTNTVALWVLLPFAILLAGVAPAAISFAAGQAAFTITLVLLFNIIVPTGWSVGLLRIEDIAIGCGVSLLVGVLFWPRGATAALRRALADAYSEGLHYLNAAVRYGLDRCEAVAPKAARPSPESLRAAAASRRLDDTFRTYLSERGTKRIPLAQVTAAVIGVAGVRLASDAIVDVWNGQDAVTGDLAGTRDALELLVERLDHWYRDFGSDLLEGAAPPEPLPPDAALEQRLAQAVATEHDASGDPLTAATAIRIVWTADYLDVVRRLQGAIVAAA